MTPRALALASITAIAFAGAAGSAEAKTSKAEKKQNTAIKKAASSAKKANTSASSATKKATAASKSAAAAIKSANQGIADAKKANDGVGVINTTVVPTAVKALGDLQAGLLALKDGLTQVVSNLTNLGAAYQAVEYGALRIYATPGGGTPAASDTVVTTVNSSDIPDDGNGALVSASVPIQVPAAATTGLDLRVRAAIRSNESDGAATGAPAGQVGAVLYAKCLVNCGAGVGGSTASGGLTCSPAGPPAAFDFGTPTGSTTPIGSQSLRNLQVKAPRSGSAAPAFDAPLATSQEGTDTKCTLPQPAGPVVPQNVAVYELTLTGQFFDFPTSTTPGATE